MFNNKQYSLIIAIIFVFFNTSDNKLYSSSQKLKEYAIIIAHKVNVRQEPDINSKVIVKLELGEGVEIITQNDVKVEIDGKIGLWVYVQTFRQACDHGNCKGWLLDYYLGYKDKFKKIEKWKHQKGFSSNNYNNCDHCPTYFINNDGDFSVIFRSFNFDHYKENDIKQIRTNCEINGGKYSRDQAYHYCSYKGHLYQYLKFIWAKIDNKNNNDFFYLNKKGNLSLPSEYCEED
jgi:hypothetical protein